MKKVFLLSTALVISGSAAFADMKVTGEAEAGYVFDSQTDEGTFDTDMDLTFSADTMTNDGMGFGAEAELNAKTGDMTSKVWAKGAFGTINMGDVDGAMEATVADAFGSDSIGDVAEDHAGAFSNWADADVATMRYDYARDAFEVSVSFADEDAYAIAGAYKFDAGMASMRVAAATQKGNGADVMGGSVEADLKNGVKATVSYADQKMGAAEGTNMGVAVAYAMNDLELGANYGQNDDGTTKTDGYGLTAGYDLGGGVKAKAGYGDKGDFSMGLAMKF